MNMRKELDSTQKYYVYGLFDPEKAFPFYVGKGTGNRKNDHFKDSSSGINPYKDRKIAKIKRQGRKPYSEIIWDDLIEAKAYDREWALIHMTDVHPNVKLTNICYHWGTGVGSGENNPNYGSCPSLQGENHPMHKRGHTEEAKQKISEATSGENHPFYGCSHTEEAKRKMSESSKGNFPSKETREKMGKSRRGQDGSNAKLTKEKAAEIKWLLQETNMPQKEIGNEYGVVRTTISAINTEKNWDYVEPKEISR